MQSTVTSPPSLAKITPEVLFLKGLRYASAWHEGTLYLSLLRHAKGKDLRRVLRWDPKTEQWEDLHSQAVGRRVAPVKRKTDAPETEPEFSTGISLIPGERGSTFITFSFHSPCGAQTLGLHPGGTSLTELREGDEKRANKRFISCECQDGVFHAIAEQADGRRCLVRSSFAGSWEEVALPESGDRVSALALFRGRLHVAIDNQRRGFGLWKLADGEHEEAIWTSILKEGAWRYLLNPNVHAMVVSEECLYLAVGVSSDIRRKGFDLLSRAEGLEVLRVYQDGKWDIMIGTPRFTPHGLKVPFSGLGAGLDEQPTLRYGYFLKDSSGLFLGAVNALGWQTWYSADGEQWSPVWPEAFLDYQDTKIIAAYPTGQGPVVLAETCDYERDQTLQIWRCDQPV
jgi:hypothetical protein